eukprot:COSAG01_NODE_49_length_31891_cov_29.945773_20_plen_222_part_00
MLFLHSEPSEHFNHPTQGKVCNPVRTGSPSRPSVLIIIIRTLRDLLSTRSIYCRAASVQRPPRGVAAPTPVSLCLQATAAPGYPAAYISEKLALTLCFLGVGALATGHDRFSTVRPVLLKGSNMVSLTCDLFSDHLNVVSKKKIKYQLAESENALTSNIFFFLELRHISSVTKKHMSATMDQLLETFVPDSALTLSTTITSLVQQCQGNVISPASLVGAEA